MGTGAFAIINHKIKFETYNDFIQQYVKFYDLPYLIHQSNDVLKPLPEIYIGIVFTIENNEQEKTLEVNHYSGNSKWPTFSFLICKDYLCNYGFGAYNWGGYIKVFKELINYPLFKKEEHYNKVKQYHDNHLKSEYQYLGSDTYILINANLDDLIMEMVGDKMDFNTILKYCRDNMYVYSFKEFSLLTSNDFEQNDFYKKFCLIDTLELNNLH